MSEKFSLKWNDYQSNWNKTINDLRKDTDLADVTLISDDKVKFSAHKILISSCSNILKFILKDNTHPNPFLFLGGVSSVNIGYILDYIYYGEVNIYQEQLDSFLESAQKLEIKGLQGENQKSENYSNGSLSAEPKEKIKDEHTYYQPAEERGLIEMIPAQRAPRKQTKDYVTFDVGSLTPEEINAKMKELYEKSDDGWRCLACDYTSSQKSTSGNIRQHVETHMDGLSYTCHLCDKEFRSRRILNHHKNTSCRV